MARPTNLHLLLFQRRSIMFDRVGDLAEKVAINVSRRDFLGWAGKSAVALAGMLAAGGITAADQSGCGSVAGVPAGTPCPAGTKPCGGVFGFTSCIPANGCKCCCECGTCIGVKSGS